MPPLYSGAAEPAPVPGAAPPEEAGPALDASVVLVTRNRAPVLAHSLRALAGQSLDRARYEVVVVDDGSTDETAAVAAAQAAAGCPVRLVRLDRHRGISAARNRGVREARGRVIVFVDDDGLVPPTFLAAHLAAHRASRAPIVCRGPVIRTASLERPLTGRPHLLDLHTAFFDTNNASVGRAHLLRAGLFDEMLAHWEGLEMSVRLRALRLRRRYRFDAPLYHYQPPASAAGVDALLRREEERARDARRFFARHPTWEVRLATSQTPLHRWLNAAQRAFGAVHAGNVLEVMERCRRWGVPALGRVFLGGVLTERYLAGLARR
jgi:glycosyltransferase involved in cell wall biosynthesis